MSGEIYGIDPNRKPATFEVGQHVYYLQPNINKVSILRAKVVEVRDDSVVIDSWEVLHGETIARSKFVYNRSAFHTLGEVINAANTGFVELHERHSRNIQEIYDEMLGLMELAMNYPPAPDDNGR